MTYFGFLAIFLGIPLGILSLWTIRDFYRHHWLPSALSSRPAWMILLGLGVIAFMYTTPWDNYLVATRVWWYDSKLVTGIVFGYVPIEEYTFFIVQPIFTGLFLIGLMRYVSFDTQKADSWTIRKRMTIVLGIMWIVSCVLFLLSLSSPTWKGFTYLSLELSWALIPIVMQIAFGADILWRHRRTVLSVIALSTIYLSFADAIAIGAGIWSIDPQQSLNLFIGGILPIEELVFFLLTNTLVVLGTTLFLAEESQARVIAMTRLHPIMRRLSIAGDGEK